MIHSDTSPALKRLLSMSLMQRITAVAHDIDSGRDEFASIDPHDLISALGVEQPDRPATGWNFTSYAENLSLEEHVDLKGSIEGFIDHLRGNVSDSRYKKIASKFQEWEESGKSDFSFLSKKEREMIERALAEDDLERNQLNGMNCIARCAVYGVDGVELHFEGLVEDDGVCLELKTPYDERDGKFHDFRNCVTNEWNG